MNRLYLVESSPTATGSTVDHRWAMDSASMEALHNLAVSLDVGIEGNYTQTNSTN